MLQLYIVHMFAVNDILYVKDFPNAKEWMPGKMLKYVALSYLVELMSGCVVRRHVDALRFLSLAEKNTGHLGPPDEQTYVEIPSPELDAMTDSEVSASKAAPSGVFLTEPSPLEIMLHSCSSTHLRAQRVLEKAPNLLVGEYSRADIISADATSFWLLGLTVIYH